MTEGYSPKELRRATELLQETRRERMETEVLLEALTWELAEADVDAEISQTNKAGRRA